MEQNDTSYLQKIRGTTAVSGIAVILFDFVLMTLLPDEPAFTGPRYACAAISFSLFCATFVSASVRRNLGMYMMGSIVVHSLTWSYNLHISAFSTPIVLTYLIVLVGCSAMLQRRSEIKGYLALSVVAFGTALIFS